MTDATRAAAGLLAAPELVGWLDRQAAALREAIDPAGGHLHIASVLNQLRADVLGYGSTRCTIAVDHAPTGARLAVKLAWHPEGVVDNLAQAVTWLACEPRVLPYLARPLAITAGGCLISERLTSVAPPLTPRRLLAWSAAGIQVTEDGALSAAGCGGSLEALDAQAMVADGKAAARRWGEEMRRIRRELCDPEYHHRVNNWAVDDAGRLRWLDFVAVLDDGERWALPTPGVDVDQGVEWLRGRLRRLNGQGGLMLDREQLGRELRGACPTAACLSVLQ